MFKHNKFFFQPTRDSWENTRESSSSSDSVDEHDDNKHETPSKNFNINDLKYKLYFLTDASLNNTKNDVKIFRLMQFKQEIQNTNTYLDLFILLHTALLDPHLLASSFLNKGLTKKNIINLFKETESAIFQREYMVPRYEEVLFALKKDGKQAYPASFKNSNSNRFLDDMELKKLLTIYLDYYKKTNQVLVDAFKYHNLIQSQDNVLVNFDFDFVPVDHVGNTPVKNALSEKTMTNLINCFAHALMVNLKPEDFSDTLRLCFSMNHGNYHWTALMINVTGVAALYQKIYDCHKNEIGIGFNDNDVDKLFRDKLISVRRALLQITPEEFWVRNPKLPQIQDSQEPAFATLVAIFKQHNIKISANHYDSLNSNYFPNINRSMSVLCKEFKFSIKEKSCSKQKGMTCGDHTVCNLIGLALYNQLPVLNTTTTKSSEELRHLLENHDNISLHHEVEEIINSVIFNKEHSATQITKQEIKETEFKQTSFREPSTFENKKLKTLIHLFAECIYQSSSESPTNLFKAIRNNDIASLMTELNKQYSKFYPLSERPSEIKRYSNLLVWLLHPHYGYKITNVLYSDMKITAENLTDCMQTAEKYLREKEFELDKRWKQEHPEWDYPTIPTMGSFF